MAPLLQKGLDPAELTGKQSVCFVKGGRCAALGALVFDCELDSEFLE